MSPEELSMAGIRTDVPGIDCSVHSARAELDPSIEYVEIQSIELSRAYLLFVRLVKLLSAEAAADDPRIEASVERVRGIFFGAASWLGLPHSERLANYLLSIQQLKAEVDYISRYLGAESALTLNQFIEAIQDFMAVCRDAGHTPKANSILDLIAKDERAAPLFVSGSRQSCIEADEFFAGIREAAPPHQD
jgi:hypothetical protein